MHTDNPITTSTAPTIISANDVVDNAAPFDADDIASVVASAVTEIKDVLDVVEIAVENTVVVVAVVAPGQQLGDKHSAPHAALALQ